MSTVENFDGLCGIIATFGSSDLQLRCHFELGHGGPCSFEKYKDQFTISSSCGRNIEHVMEEGFVNSVRESLLKKDCKHE